MELFFLSHPLSEHVRNLVANGSTAVAVFASTQRWAGPDRGLQLFGWCEEAQGIHLRRAERVYASRFIEYGQWKGALTSESAGLDYRQFRFVPERLKLLDRPGT